MLRYFFMNNNTFRAQFTKGKFFSSSQIYLDTNPTDRESQGQKIPASWDFGVPFLGQISLGVLGPEQKILLSQRSSLGQKCLRLETTVLWRSLNQIYNSLFWIFSFILIFSILIEKFSIRVSKSIFSSSKSSNKFDQKTWLSMAWNILIDLFLKGRSLLANQD